MTPSDDMTTLAGRAGAFGSADGTGDAARFADPSCGALDANGDLCYLADTDDHAVGR